MKCSICGSYTAGSSRTCKYCLAKGLKWCNNCGRVLPIENFSKMPNGLSSRCICCPGNNKMRPTSTKQSTRQRTTKCKKCKYSFNVGSQKGLTYYCQYILIEGHSRGCEPANCDKFVPIDTKRTKAT